MLEVDVVTGEISQIRYHKDEFVRAISPLQCLGLPRPTFPRAITLLVPTVSVDELEIIGYSTVLS